MGEGDTKTGLATKLIVGIGGLIILTIIVFLIISTVTDIYEGVDPDISVSSSQSILADNASAQTLTPVGEGITSNNATAKNNTYLNFTTDDRLFIEDNSYETISYWVNDSSNNWIHVVNTSGILYEDGSEVSSLTLNSYKKNATGWYLGENSSGFFTGNIDDIRFYNDTINESIVDEIFANGR